MDSATQQREAEALAKAEHLAALEGLHLVRANSKSGFFKVEMGSGKCPTYTVRDGHDRTSLGSFDTAAEAALFYARTIGPEGCTAAAARPARKRVNSVHHGSEHTFGTLKRSAELAQPAHFVSVQATPIDDELSSAPEVVESTAVTPSARLSRTKSRRIDEYVVCLSAGDQTMTVPIPPDALRGRNMVVKISYDIV